ncbi:MAG TPA: type VI secretion system-associated protein TagO [Vineibacter sp.]|nr:type VI secretion system-associated protein TagO [Vineibacter sp.]
MRKPAPIVLAAVFAALPAFAASAQTADPAAVMQWSAAKACAQLELPILRLACFDRIFSADRAQNPWGVTRGPWKAVVQKDPIDDSVITAAVKPSEEEVVLPFPLGPSFLVIRCVSRAISAVVLVPASIGDKTAPGAYRIDAEPAIDLTWDVFDGRNVVGLGDPVSATLLLEHVLRGGKLAIRVTPKNGDAVTATFNLDGIRAAAQPVEAACSK